MPISAARLAANRANAQLSTGPKSGAAKAISCLNRFSHGLSGSNFHLVPWENHAEFERLRDALLAEHQPATPTEAMLIHRMAEHHWLRGRALVFQEISLDAETPHVHNEKQLALFLRDEAMHERAFHRCLTEFLKLKKTRLVSEVGFESQTPESACEPASTSDAPGLVAVVPPPAPVPVTWKTPPRPARSRQNPSARRAFPRH